MQREINDITYKELENLIGIMKKNRLRANPSLRIKEAIEAVYSGKDISIDVITKERNYLPFTELDIHSARSQKTGEQISYFQLTENDIYLFGKCPGVKVSLLILKSKGKKIRCEVQATKIDLKNPHKAIEPFLKECNFIN